MNFNPRSLAGATVVSATDLVRGVNFNPRSLAGATETTKQGLAAYLFQSTLPRGSDLRGMLSISRSINFNPRSLAGATINRHRADTI